MSFFDDKMATPRVFDAFLDELPHDTLLSPHMTRHCPLALFLSSFGYREVEVGLENILYADQWHNKFRVKCPVWARVFQEMAMDARNEATDSDWSACDYGTAWNVALRRRIHVATCRRILEMVMLVS